MGFILVPFASLLSLALSVPSSLSQLTNATCQSGFDWSFNSRGQSPCNITSYLVSACLADPADAWLDAIPAGFHYTLPQPDATECQCNTVFYSTISACARCQGDISLPWSTWQENCTQSFIQQFPKPVPIGTAIPAWAYLDVVFLDDFNATAAEIESATNKTEITASSPTPSSTSSFITQTTSSQTTGISSSRILNPTQTATSDTAQVNRKTNVGAVVGGSIAAVIVIIIGAATSASYYKRRRTQTRRSASAQFAEARKSAPVFTPLVSGRRIYNPDDPTTFPDVQTPSTDTYGMRQVSPNVPSASYARGVLHYNAMAEI